MRATYGDLTTPWDRLTRRFVHRAQPQNNCSVLAYCSRFICPQDIASSRQYLAADDIS